MQIKSLRVKSYNSWPVADSPGEQSCARLKQLELFDQLKAQGFSTALCLHPIEWSKATD